MQPAAPASMAGMVRSATSPVPEELRHPATCMADVHPAAGANALTDGEVRVVKHPFVTLFVSKARARHPTWNQFWIASTLRLCLHWEPLLTGSVCATPALPAPAAISPRLARPAALSLGLAMAFAKQSVSTAHAKMTEATATRLPPALARSRGLGTIYVTRSATYQLVLGRLETVLSASTVATVVVCLSAHALAIVRTPTQMDVMAMSTFLVMAFVIKLSTPVAADLMVVTACSSPQATGVHQVASRS